MNQTPVEAFKAFYADFSSDHLNLLSQIYSDDVVFIDPVHELKGLEALRRYYEKAFEGPEYTKFVFVDEVVQSTNVMLTWQMHFAHKKLKGGSDIIVEGVSHLRFDGESQKCTFHRDYYDLGQMLYEHVPVLGSIVTYLKNKLALPCIQR